MTKPYPCIMLLIVLFLSGCASQVTYNLPAKNSRRVYTGLENFISGDAKKYRGKRAVLVTNHSGVDFDLRKNIDLLRERGMEISIILAPEHGVYGFENVYDRRVYHRDGRLNALVYNLHHFTVPQLRYLVRGADAVVFDIQDMGLRCYTYISVLKLVMDALNGNAPELIVLDRPNPLGFLGVDGPYLRREFSSRHISAFPSTFMYGMTMGEAARYYRGEFAREVRLRVVPLDNYGKDTLYNETMLPWVPPSPNLPTYESAIVYSAIVMLEGVNVSVGRGTPKPFEYIGAPWIDPVSFCRGLDGLHLRGFKFRPIYFAPTFSKYSGMRCGGVQVFYVGGRFSPMEVSYRILAYLRDNYRMCRWERFGGNYDIDFLTGTDAYRIAIDRKTPFGEYEKELRREKKEFNRKRKRYLLY